MKLPVILLVFVAACMQPYTSEIDAGVSTAGLSTNPGTDEVCVFARCNPYVASVNCTGSPGSSSCKLSVDYNPIANNSCNVCASTGETASCPNFFSLQTVVDDAIAHCRVSGSVDFQCEQDYIDNYRIACQFFTDDP